MLFVIIVLLVIFADSFTTSILFFIFISFAGFSFGYWLLVIGGIKLNVLAGCSFWLNLIILFVESDIEQPLMFLYPALELLLDLGLNFLFAVGQILAIGPNILIF